MEIRYVDIYSCVDIVAMAKKYEAMYELEITVTKIDKHISDRLSSWTIRVVRISDSKTEYFNLENSSIEEVYEKFELPIVSSFLVV